MEKRTTTEFYRTLLKLELEQRVQRNPKYSLRSFANFLRVNVGGLSRILSGQAPLSLKMANKICDRLDLTLEQRSMFIKSVYSLQKVRDLKRRDLNVKKFLNSPAHSMTWIEDKTAEIMSEWYYSALIELTELKNFRADQKWIAKQLNISESQAQVAWQRLLDLQIVVMSGQRYKKRQDYLLSPEYKKTANHLRKKQRQIREKAIESLQNDDIDVRSMTSVTMCIDRRRFAEAVEKINQFNLEMTSNLTSGEQNHVYALEISFFPLQILQKGEDL